MNHQFNRVLVLVVAINLVAGSLALAGPSIKPSTIAESLAWMTKKDSVSMLSPEGLEAYKAFLRRELSDTLHVNKMPGDPYVLMIPSKDSRGALVEVMDLGLNGSLVRKSFYLPKTAGEATKLTTSGVVGGGYQFSRTFKLESKEIRMSENYSEVPTATGGIREQNLFSVTTNREGNSNYKAMDSITLKKLSNRGFDYQSNINGVPVSSFLRIEIKGDLVHYKTTPDGKTMTVEAIDRSSGEPELREYVYSLEIKKGLLGYDEAQATLQSTRPLPKANLAEYAVRSVPFEGRSVVSASAGSVDGLKIEAQK